MMNRKKLIKPVAVYGLLICAMIAGHYVDRHIYKEKIKKMHAPRPMIEDLNLDPIPDLVIQNEDGEIFLYLGDKTGFRYVTLNELREIMREKDKSMEELQRERGRNSLNDKLGEI